MQSAKQFDAWLTEASTTQSGAARERALTNWKAAPGALACHPRSEHLIPLMVVVGAAYEDPGVCTYKDAVFGKSVSGFRFG
jgi:aromatic ring-opening dioxygenase catalytic subunit (LigB family)